MPKMEEPEDGDLENWREVHEYFYDILQGAQPGYRSFSYKRVGSHIQPGKYTKADHYIAL